MKLALSGPGWRACAAATGTTHARGQAFDATGRLLRAGDLARRFGAATGLEDWVALARTLNGCFAVAHSGPGRALALVDRIRSVPLFHTRTAEGTVLADIAEPLTAALQTYRVDALAAAEFRLLGYTTGASTLIEGLFQVPPGHALELSDSAAPRVARHYAFEHRDFLVGEETALIDRLAELHERVFRRLVDDVGDRSIVVPLSGGHDSRLVGTMLRDLGARDVLCYTYGSPGNWEARISQELATHLGFRWTMVPYTAERWHAWRALPELARYCRESGNAAASPHFQDWPAVLELKREGRVAPDAVFVPGHSGDFLAGSHVPRKFVERARHTRVDILEALFSAHYNLWAWPADTDGALRDRLATRVEAVSGPLGEGDAEYAADRFEAWDCAERQAKFIVNAVRVYEAFGHEWRLPLFDAELMDFWSRIPVTRRVGRSLYFAYERARLALPITPANTDRAAPAAAVVAFIDKAGLKPLAAHARALWRRLFWRSEYQGGTLAWFGAIDRDEFRRRYTGHEIGHSFFAAKFLEEIAHGRRE